MADGTTIGVWVGENDDVLEEFDDAFPEASRSEKIKDAMRLYVAVQEVIDEVDYDLGPEASKRHWVRQALFDRVRTEANEGDTS